MAQGRWPSLAAMLRHMMLREEWMSVKEAAELYRVTTDTMLVWAQAGKFSARRIDGELWLSRDELLGALRRAPARPPRQRSS
jgi:excisionase family DNA binding protein